MNIAEFFVKLGIKGDGEAQKGIKNVNTQMNSLLDSGLAVKAGLFGVVYGLGALSRNSAQTGADLMSFATSTGMSIDFLQRWQGAAMRANVSSESMKQSIVGMQKTMQGMAEGKAAPEGFNIFSNAVKLDTRRAQTDMQYFLAKVREYAQLEKNVPFANERLRSLGITDEMIGAMRSGRMNDDILKKMPVYSAGQAKSLDQVNQQMVALGQQWEMGMGKIVAQFGPQFAKDLRGVTTELLKMIDAFAQMAKTTDMLKGLTKMFEGWKNIFSWITASADYIGKGKLGEDLYNNTLGLLDEKGGKRSAMLYQQWQNGLKFNPNDTFNNQKMYREYVAQLNKERSETPPVVNINAQGTSAREIAVEVDRRLKKKVNKAAGNSKTKVEHN